MTSRDHDRPERDPRTHSGSARGDAPEAGPKGRGRTAERPRDVPKSGWRDVALRVKDQVREDNLGLVAAGVAFFAFLSLFPALAALVSIYGLIADPADVQQQMQAVGGAMPEEAGGIIQQQLDSVARASGGALGLGFAVSLALALWSANKGTKNLMTALSIAYDEPEDRGFFKLNLTSLAITLGAMLLAIVAIGAVVVLPAALGAVGLGAAAEITIRLLRWPLLAAVILGGLAIVYRYGPNREHAEWRWTTPGSILATALWLVGSIAFSIYVSNFGAYDATYGSLGAVVILLLWFFMSAFVILLGAEVNAELERQTERDTTTGEPRARGHREAWAADTVGQTP